jgi:hypothetical protein
MKDLNEFIKNAIKTESRVDKIMVDENVLYNALFTFIEAAEVLDILKKNIFYNKPIDNSVLKENPIGGIILSNYKIDNMNELSVNTRLFHAILGICTESGELAGNLYDSLILGKNLDLINLGEELGDLDWYKAIALDEMNLDPYKCLNAVIEKLKLRYPDKFSSENAVNRNLDKERKSLESNLG